MLKNYNTVQKLEGKRKKHFENTFETLKTLFTWKEDTSFKNIKNSYRLQNSGIYTQMNLKLK